MRSQGCQRPAAFDGSSAIFTDSEASHHLSARSGPNLTRVLSAAAPMGQPDCIGCEIFHADEPIWVRLPRDGACNNGHSLYLEHMGAPPPTECRSLRTLQANHPQQPRSSSSPPSRAGTAADCHSGLDHSKKTPGRSSSSRVAFDTVGRFGLRWNVRCLRQAAPAYADGDDATRS
jgi:hypothetical protein